ncbi:hypothetical protein M231_07195 [Tremella mesenterica]|uniref:Uncharacterized protein n=1 Tax=Tremella mesenterica TaxID=5217 RepID=A0A4Q1BFY3_TREME|nr:hypothetical protein M231_07195 [Tremella mesenterica]
MSNPNPPLSRLPPGAWQPQVTNSTVPRTTHRPPPVPGDDDSGSESGSETGRSDDYSYRLGRRQSTGRTSPDASQAATQLGPSSTSRRFTDSPPPFDRLTIEGEGSANTRSTRPLGTGRAGESVDPIMESLERIIVWPQGDGIPPWATDAKQSWAHDQKWTAWVFMSVVKKSISERLVDFSGERTKQHDRERAESGNHNHCYRSHKQIEACLTDQVLSYIQNRMTASLPKSTLHDRGDGDQVLRLQTMFIGVDRFDKKMAAEIFVDRIGQVVYAPDEGFSPSGDVSGSRTDGHGHKHRPRPSHSTSHGVSGGESLIPLVYPGGWASKERQRVETAPISAQWTYFKGFTVYRAPTRPSWLQNCTLDHHDGNYCANGYDAYFTLINEMTALLERCLNDTWSDQRSIEQTPDHPNQTMQTPEISKNQVLLNLGNRLVEVLDNDRIQRSELRKRPIQLTSLGVDVKRLPGTQTARAKIQGTIILNTQPYKLHEVEDGPWP